MTEDELAYVISSTGLTGEDGSRATPVLDICPRTRLGLSCIKEQYECLCEITEMYTTQIERVDGKPVAVGLIMSVAARGMDSAQAVIAGVELTGLLADIEVSGHQVRASFSLNKNHHLRTYVLNNWV